MSEKDLKELEKILNNSLSAHQRADWSNREARKTIVIFIIKKFKQYLERKIQAFLTSHTLVTPNKAFWLLTRQPSL